ncbi:MAG: oxidoreductase, aryl-alcohol dehydrogenase-like [Parcubacteria group bacterium Gr01-1014_44]|nr:MAG: oxidoreductase, aryl-alcohol dehydrogenase-like [Parcubacteria group bacterium Gr01-1014_44]
MIYKTLGRTGLKVSRVGLGTAEIGFAYGIGKRFLPSEEEAIRLLKMAVDLEITYFDTAYFYGLAEERIGKSGIMKSSDVVVATKCGKFLEEGEDPRGAELEKRLREHVEASLERLGVDCLPLLMLHGGSKEQLERGELVEIFKKFQREGKARFIGISTRGEENTLAAIQSGAFDVIQVAYSILDQRMAKHVLPLAMEKNIGVINRSVFLKGALTPLGEKLPDKLLPLKLHSKMADGVAQYLKVDLPALALRFSLSNEAISISLVGTNSWWNLSKSVMAVEAGLLSNGLLPNEIISELKELAIDDPSQVDPIRWPPIPS